MLTDPARRALTFVAAVAVTGASASCSAEAAHEVRARGASAVGSAKSAAASVEARAKASLSSRASAKADGKKLIEKVQWVRTAGGGSLHVTPTAAGRADPSPTGNVAWIQVQRIAAVEGGVEAAVVDKPGMKAQFVCHWQFARVKEPHKPSWNLEPWRPVVSERALIDARCNPGGAEGPDQ